MKTPTTLDDIMAEWNKDSIIDELNVQKELLKIASLKAKYMKVLTCHNVKVKDLEKEYNKLKKIKWEYYSGDLNNPQDLATYGYEPWVKKTLRQDIPMYLDADKELVNILLKKVIHQEITEVCKEILKELNNRTYQIRGFIDWQKFLAGN